ncbi:MAG: hypothetical protein IH845_05140 [Nanoarchaeota archaeon]|nr:hypothetical protein [Nanoarchaeota archaeon]
MKLQKKKIMVGGIQTSGKSYFVKNMLIPNFRKPILFEVHPDFRECENLLIYRPSEPTVKELNDFCLKVKALGLAGKIDAFILDEADMFMMSILGKELNNLNDLVINHAHYGLALVFVTRRPQDIPPKITESSHYIIMFTVEGKNVFDRLKGISEEFEEAVRKLDYDYRDFVVKEIGRKPITYNPLP